MNIVGLQSVFVFRPGKKPDSVKLCKTCKYYEANNERCKIFGNVNVVNGHVEYNFASYERGVQGQCGMEAKYWSPNTFFIRADRISTKPKPFIALKDAIYIESAENADSSENIEYRDI